MAPPVRRTVDAFVQPLNLAPTGVGTVAAGVLLVVGQVPLALLAGGLGLVATGALVAWDLFGTSAAPPPEADWALPKSAQLRAELIEIHGGLARLRARVAEHEDAVVADALRSLEQDAAQLVVVADRIAARGDTIHELLDAQSSDQLTRSARERRAAARQAADPAVAKALKAAADANEREHATWRELATLYDRIVAELVATDAALDELHARVVRLAVSDPGDTSADDVGTELGALRGRLETLERAAAQTMKEMP